jgi:hypothetical protein
MAEPKQHHYIPETYLEQFCDSSGVLWVHDKWSGKSFPSRPPSVLKEKFYYAQPDHENKIWNHEIEEFFSKKIETFWPETVRLIQNGPRHIKDLYNLYMWMYSLRVRVPSCRKAVEYSLQEQVRLIGATINDKEFIKREKKIVEHFNKALNKNYKCMDDLYDDGAINITIDPHKSLLAMADIAKGFSRVVSDLQFHFIKNCTAIDFNCSDNPIVYFPARQRTDGCTPYQYRPGQPFEFIFPITKRHCLYHNSFNPIAPQEIVATETSNIGFVRRINDFVGAFADRYVVSSRRLTDSEMPRRNHCPRPRAYRLPQPRGTALILHYEMGEPLRLPKWKHRFETADEQA